VMRALYNDYFRQKQRGFRDEEFRSVCERIAGVPLGEIFDDYIATTKEIDYQKYFALAGLQIDTELRAQPGAWLGAVFGNSNRGLRPTPASPDSAQVISRIEDDSPAQHAGLSVEDEILAIDGVRSAKVTDALRARKPGDRMKLLIVRDHRIREIEVVLGTKMERSFKIEPLENPSPQQSSVLKGLLG